MTNKRNKRLKELVALWMIGEGIIGAVHSKNSIFV
jgi:hypothetical protein